MLTLKFYLMKTLKSIVVLFLFSMLVFSCTDTDLEDELADTIENTQATGDDSEAEDGSKD